MLSTHLVVAGLSTGNKIGLADGRGDLHRLRARLVVRPAAAQPELPGPVRRLVLGARGAVLRRDDHARCSSSARRATEAARRPRTPNTLTVATAPTAGDRRRRGGGEGRRGCRQGGLRHRRLRRLPHAEGGGRDRATSARTSTSCSPNFEAVHDQVENGGGAMPAFKGQLSRSRSRTSPRTSPPRRTA